MHYFSRSSERFDVIHIKHLLFFNQLKHYTTFHFLQLEIPAFFAMHSSTRYFSALAVNDLLTCSRMKRHDIIRDAIQFSPFAHSITLNVFRFYCKQASF